MRFLLPISIRSRPSETTRENKNYRSTCKDKKTLKKRGDGRIDKEIRTWVESEGPEDSSAVKFAVELVLLKPFVKLNFDPCINNNESREAKS